MPATSHTTWAERVTRPATAGLGLVADLLFPRRCGVCGRFGSFLCAACRDSLLLLPATVTEPVRGIDTLVAACAYEGNAQTLVHRLKYDRLSALAEPVAALMAAAWQQQCGAGSGEATLFVPVPLHIRRERERGFNQSALLARQVARGTGCECATSALARVRPTRPQARQAAVADRIANVEGAFAVRRDVRGRQIVLVDDVATTGATLAACAAVLRAGGATTVDALVFARA